VITLRGKPGKVGVFVSEPVSDGLDATTREVAAGLDQLIERDHADEGAAILDAAIVVSA
jgi:hypothetical protein